MKAFLLFLVLTACSTTTATVAVLPEAPNHPALENPEIMSEKDREKLANFYRQYEIFLKKYQAYKKTFGK